MACSALSALSIPAFNPGSRWRWIRFQFLRRFARPRGVWSLAGPVLLQELALVLTGTVVMALASHLGASAVAAIGMIDALGFLLNAVYGGLAIGATVTVAHCLGAGRRNDLRAVAWSAVLLAVASALGVATLLWTTRALWIATLLPGAEQVVVVQADLYFRWLIVAGLPTSLVLVSCGVLRGMARTDAAMRVQVTMNLAQVLLAALFMRGEHGSVGGAGAALLMARSGGVVLVLLSLWPTMKRAAAHARGWPARGDFMRAILRVGWPAALETSFFHIGKLITQTMVVGLGTAAMASNFIAFYIGAFLNTPGTALGVAATTLVGMRLGAGRAAAAQRVLRRVIRSANWSLTGLALLMLPLSWPLAQLFGNDAEVSRMAAWLIALSCVFMPAWAGSFVLPAGLRGAGDTRYALAVATSTMWGLRIGAGYLMGIVLGLGVVGVWLGMFGDWLVRNWLFRRRMRGSAWLHHRLLG
ncbi:MAG: MATE family efflux transporter [Rhizobacter sp.]|nr:MATE family efflux transporter [Rhizobacter sp.]